MDFNIRIVISNIVIIYRIKGLQGIFILKLQKMWKKAELSSSADISTYVIICDSHVHF